MDVIFSKGDFDKSLKNLMTLYGPELCNHIVGLENELRRANSIELLQVAHCRKMISDSDFEDIIKSTLNRYYKDIEWTR
jgi:hypothetical protein